nr:hypothetical protein [Tanacetum cinerariifolium]
MGEPLGRPGDGNLRSTSPIGKNFPHDLGVPYMVLLLGGKRYSEGIRYSEGRRYSKGTCYSEGKRYSEGTHYSEDKRYSEGTRYFKDKRYSKGTHYFEDKRYSEGTRYLEDKHYSEATPCNLSCLILLLRGDSNCVVSCCSLSTSPPPSFIALLADVMKVGDKVIISGSTAMIMDLNGSINCKGVKKRTLRIKASLILSEDLGSVGGLESSVENGLRWVTNQTMKDSIAYKTYLAFATRAATSKKARKFKKRVSPSKKRTPVLVEEPVRESAKNLKPAKKVVPSKKPSRKQPPGVVIRDTHDVSVPKKKTPARVEKNKCIV